jgi:hypothetical protein
MGMIKYFLAVCLISLAACGAASSDSKLADVNLFKEWCSTASSACIQLQFQDYDSESVAVSMGANGWCSCQMDIVGNNSSGSLTLSSCSHSGGGADLCPSLEIPVTYTNNGSTLSVCDGSGCVDWF